MEGRTLHLHLAMALKLAIVCNPQGRITYDVEGFLDVAEESGVLGALLGGEVDRLVRVVIEHQSFVRGADNGRFGGLEYAECRVVGRWLHIVVSRVDHTVWLSFICVSGLEL